MFQAYYQLPRSLDESVTDIPNQTGNGQLRSMERKSWTKDIDRSWPDLFDFERFRRSFDGQILI